MIREEPPETADQISISSAITELKIGGDLRLRYQWDQRDFQADPPETGARNSSGDEDCSPSGSQRSRWRMRLRLRADFKLGPQFFGGVQVGTGQAADADNQTFQDGYSDYNIYISRAFIGWNASDWLTLVGGKQPNPLYWSELVWSTEVSPTGLTQTVKLDSLWRSFEGGTPGKWSFTLNLGEFIYDDNNEDVSDGDESSDAYMFAVQVVSTYAPRKDLKFIVAPGAIFYNAADISGFINENCFDNRISGETRDLMILGLPGEVATVVAKQPVRCFWDVAWNPRGKDRYRNVYDLGDGHSFRDDIAWLAGVQVGKNVAPGDISFVASWRENGICAVDPNINDGDFALGELNSRGVKLTGIYSLTAFSNFTLSYSHAWNLRDHLAGGEATAGAAVADMNSVDYVQLDFNTKF